MLARVHRCALSLQTRPEKVTSAFLDAVQDSAADVTLECGVQTFEPRELQAIGRVKGANAEALARKVDEKLEMMRRRGVAFELSLIYGLPHQTLDSFKRSLDRAHASGARRVDAHPLMLLRGTELHRRRSELGLVEGLDAFRHVEGGAARRVQRFIPHVVATPAMSSNEWREAAALAAL